MTHWSDAEFGARVREVRIAAGFTQADFGQLLGFSQSGIANIETGAQRVYAEDAVRVAEVTQVDLTWLLTG